MYYFQCAGVLHTGYDNREVIREEYEVLCEDRPCSLKYLVAKSVRDRLKDLELKQSKRCTTKLNKVILSIEQFFAALCRKVNTFCVFEEIVKFVKFRNLRNINVLVHIL